MTDINKAGRKTINETLLYSSTFFEKSYNDSSF